MVQGSKSTLLPIRAKHGVEWSRLDQNSSSDSNGRSTARNNLSRLVVGLGPYLLLTGLTIAILVCVLRLWLADFAVPFGDRGDSLCAQAWVKSVQDHGWFLHNPDLGAPWGADLYDYPLADDVHFLTIRALSLVVRSPAALFNLYFLLQFPLVACASFFVMQRLGIADGLALVGSILYAFLPFHLLRGLSHFLLASYYLVPFQVLLLVRLGQFDQRKDVSQFFKSRGDWAKALVLCFLVGGAGIYYAFFGCFFYVLAGLQASWQRRSWQNLRIAFLLSLATFVAVGIHLAPQIIYLRSNGMSPEAVTRAPSDSELLGLKIAHLLLPVNGHRAAFLADLKARYIDSGLLNNENLDASLGLLGSAGFLFLLLRVLGHRSEQTQALDTLTIANLGAVLLGTIGGFGVLFSLFISSWIRAYNRVSVFVAFFAFSGLALFLTPLVRRLARQSLGMWIYMFCLIALLSFGIWDQTSTEMIPNYARLKVWHESDAAFVRDMENELNSGAMVFQLPYIPFPEARSFDKCQSYDHLRPYLNSKSLRWSFGGFRGRPADMFVHLLSSLPPDNMLRALAVAGFQAVVIDRFAYRDQSGEFEQTVGAILDQSPRVSRDGRWSFFALNDFTVKLRSRISESHWQQASRDLSRPILPVFGAGFSPEEGPPDAAFRWGKATAELRLVNSERHPRVVEVAFDADRLTTEAVHLEVICPSSKQTFLIGYGKQRFHFRMQAIPGATTLRFVCDGTPVKIPTDSREMVFRLANLTVLPESVP